MVDKIIIVCNENCKIEISSDTPNFKELAQFVCHNLDYDFNKIKIECDDKEFDVNTFKLALVGTIESIRTALQIDKKDYFDSKERAK